MYTYPCMSYLVVLTLKTIYCSHLEDCLQVSPLVETLKQAVRRGSLHRQLHHHHPPHQERTPKGEEASRRKNKGDTSAGKRQINHRHDDAARGTLRSTKKTRKICPCWTIDEIAGGEQLLRLVSRRFFIAFFGRHDRKQRKGRRQFRAPKNGAHVRAT